MPDAVLFLLEFHNYDLWTFSRVFECCFATSFSPVPQMDIIRAMVIVWRVRGKIIRSVLCILCATTVHSAVHTHTHTYEQT